MPCYKLTIAYRGTAYCGWQVQQNGISVCAAFQQAVQRLTGERGDVKGCSRTDAGVHANGFVLRLCCTAAIPPQGLLRGLNAVLPPDIAALACEEVSECFHPRYDCTGKRYLYRIYNSPLPSPFLADLALRWPQQLDADALDREAQAFLGTHDFSAFCAAGSSIPPGKRTRTITACAVSRADEEVIFSVTGNGFLYNMVRIMAGTLLEISAGRIPAGTLSDIIESKDRARAGMTAPARGLYLDRVFYE